MLDAMIVRGLALRTQEAYVDTCLKCQGTPHVAQTTAGVKRLPVPGNDAQNLPQATWPPCKEVL